MNTSAILTKALDTLRSRGWVKGNYVDRHSRRCMIGALDYTCTGRGERRVTDRLLAQVIREQYPRRIPKAVDDEDNGRCIIISFNDRKSTTFTDVERVFEKAIVKAQEVVE